jgi:hypothetical protein
MPSIAESLRKAGYLQKLGQGFKSFFEERKRKADQQVFNKIMQEAVSNIQKSFAGEEEPTFTPGTRLEQDLKKPTIVDDPTKPGIEISEVPEDIVLGDVTGRKYGTITADEQRMKIQKSIVDALLKSKNLENLDPDILKTGIGSLELLGEAVTPKKVTKEFKQFDPKKPLYELDSEGKFRLVREAILPNKEKVVGSYTGEDGFHYTKMFDPATGEVREIKSKNPVRPRKSARFKFEFPKPEKWNDFGAILNFIELKEDTEGKMIPTTEKEKKANREIAQNLAFGRMLPGAVDFTRSRIFAAWERENMSQADFEAEIDEGLESGELSPEEAQDLLDYNKFRPYLYDTLIESVKVNPEEEQ